MTRRSKAAVEPPPAAVRSKPELVNLAIELLVPNPRNARTHDDAQIGRLMASLERDGQTKPVLARRSNHMLIAGHGITDAATRLGWTHLAVLLWDVDQATADRVMLADNRLAELSGTDKARMAQLLGEVDQADYLATGFSEDEVAKLMGAVDEVLEVVTIETTEVRDDFWVTCRGPLAKQAEVLDRIKVLLREYPEVAIELGTVTGI